MRLMILVFALATLGGCAYLSPPQPLGVNEAYACEPGSAIRYKMPEWQIAGPLRPAPKHGTCAHQ